MGSGNSTQQFGGKASGVQEADVSSGDGGAGRPAVSAESGNVGPEENVLASFVANYIVDGRPLEGRLYLTDQRLVFKPSHVGGQVALSTGWPDIASADVEPRGSGAPRRRLRVTTVSGQVGLFVVWRPAKAASAIEAARLGLDLPMG